MKMKFFKTWDTTRWLIVSIIVLLLSFMLMIATFTLATQDKQHDDEYLGYVENHQAAYIEATKQHRISLAALLTYDTIQTYRTIQNDQKERC